MRTRALLSFGTGIGILISCTAPVPAPERPVIRARFDPAAGVIPRPTDLLRDRERNRLAIPDSPEALANKSPAEIGVIRELNTRDGWPSRTAAELTFSGAIDPASVTAESVRVYAVTELGIQPVQLSARLDRADHLVIDPPAEGWSRGGEYFAAAFGGDAAEALLGVGGEVVVADAAFYFLRAREPLTAHPAALPQPEAEKLEQLRLELAPKLEYLEALGLERRNLVALWAFTITEAPEIVMDRTLGKMPLPSDFLRDPVSGLVDLPARDDDSSLRARMKHDLRELDGFGLSSDLLFEINAPIDPATLTAEAVRLYAIDDAAGRAVEIPVTVHSKYGDTGITITLADRPLAPGTDHLVVVSDALKDTRGRSVEVMLPGVFAMLEAPIFENGASTIASVDAESAARVEVVRAKVARALALASIDRRGVAAAWPFRTQSAVEPLLRARDAAALAGLSPDPLDISVSTPLQAGLNFPLASLTLFAVDRVIDGTILVPDFIDPLTRKARSGGAWEPRRVPFTMTIPRGVDRAAPLRVAIFGHGLMAERRFVLAIADALAAEGLAAISIDFPFHGERTHCVWSGPQCILNPLDQTGELICPDPCRADSTCAPDGRCVDGSGQGNHLSRWPLVGFPQASGGAFLEVENLMGTRDHFHQSLTDLSALARSLREGDWQTAITHPIDPQLGYVGQSLGGIMGALFAAAHPELERAVLNVPGADLIELFRESTVFGAHMDAFLAREMITPGTPDHELVLNVARWIMDAVDPQTFAPYLQGASIEPDHTPLGARRTLLIQMATLDFVIGNPQTLLLERLSGVPRRDYLAEHAFLTIPVEIPAYQLGTRDVARVLARGELP